MKIFVFVFLSMLFCSASFGQKYFNKTESDSRYVKAIDGVDGYSAAEVDSIVLFVISVDAGAIASPADATTYYIGSLIATPSTSISGARQITLPFACTLVGYSAELFASAISSNETFSIYIRKNDAVDVELSNTFNFNTTAFLPRYFSSSLFSIPYVAGDKIELKIVTPTWATNPTSTLFSFKLFFRPKL